MVGRLVRLDLVCLTNEADKLILLGIEGASIPSYILIIVQQRMVHLLAACLVETGIDSEPSNSVNQRKQTT